MSRKGKFSKQFLKFSASLASSAVFIFFLGFSVTAQNRITVRPETIIESDRVTLGDIADVSGRDVARLKQIALGYAPQPGMIREISKDKIRLAIAAAGFSSGEFTLESAALARVSRASQTIDQNILREAIQKALLPSLAASGVEAKIVRLDLPERIELQAGKIEVRANAGNVANLFSPFAVSLEIRVDGSVARRISANVQLEAFADILVAAKDLAANSKIIAQDAAVEKRKLSKPLQNYLRSAESLRGAVVVKNVAAGGELMIDSIIAGIVVKTGDRVRIIGKSGKLQISVEGEARSPGKIGSRIMVKNLQSNAVLQAVVVDEGIVQINF